MHSTGQAFFTLFRKYKFNKVISIILFLILLLSACNKGSINTTEPNGAVPSAPSFSEPAPAIIDPKTNAMNVQANEAGKVMILMYHVIGAEKEAAWIQTVDNFRRDLKNLYDQGYSLISLQDLVTNNINTPPGRTPVVLTFDDGTEGHFRYIVSKEGNIEIDPDCAVGILKDFGNKYPEFGHTATFYINDLPFRQREFRQEKLRHLVELGFDIGNHTLTHPKLNKISDVAVQKELAGLAKMAEEAVPGYKVQSLALPHGLSPVNTGLTAKGSYAGYTYEHNSVLLVGANPSLSPAVKGFDPLRLPRVQASTVELTKWLEYFQKRPNERYISDGDPNAVAIPKDRLDLINEESVKDKSLVIY